MTCRFRSMSGEFFSNLLRRVAGRMGVPVVVRMTIRVVVMIPLVMAMRVRNDGRPSGRGQLIPSTRSRSLPREADFDAWARDT